MDTPSQIGATAEREVAYALERAGWIVYLPMFAAHSRVDLVAIGATAQALRIQVKTTRLLRHLRLVPSANNQTAGVRLASDYELRPTT